MMEARSGADGSMIADYELAITYNELGVAYGAKEMWDDAIQCFKRSMAITAQQEMFEEFHLGWCAPNPGFMYWILNRLEEAENVFVYMLEVFERKFGKDDTESFK